MPGNQRHQFFISPPIDGRRFHSCEPRATVDLFKSAYPRVGSYLNRNRLHKASRREAREKTTLRHKSCAVWSCVWRGIVVGSKKVEGDVWLRADNPTVMRYRRNVKQLACSQLEYCTIVERGRRSARQDKTDMLHLAARGTHARSDVFAPLPSRLVGGASNSHSPMRTSSKRPFCSTRTSSGASKRLRMTVT